MAYRGKSLFPKIVAKSVPMRSAAELQKYRNRKRRFLAEGGGPVNPFLSLMTTLQSGAAQLIAHPLEYGSMFIDRAGTTPVTAPGQQVGRVLDVGGGGYHATAISDAARGIYREVGGLKYIEYNGVNTAYQTAALPAPGVDKAQVFAGLRKLSDAAAGVVAELGANNTNAFVLFGPPFATSRFRFVSGGSTSTTAETDSSFPAPLTAVISGLGDISGDSTLLRIGGTQAVQSLDDQGTGNYNPAGNRALNYGSRAGGFSFWNGHHYGTLGPIVRFGTNATEDQIAAAEAYYTKETGL